MINSSVIHLNNANPLATPQMTCSAPPVGNWLTSATGGCSGGELLDVSSTDQSARVCASP